MVFAFFAGGGAVKFVKDYAAAGLNKTDPARMASGFLTDGTLEAQGAAAQGLLTTLHYADNLDTPRNNAFRKAYALAYKANADVYAVQGYDAAQILGAGLNAVKGDLSKREALTAAMRKVTVDSPRGKFTISARRQPGAGHLPARGQGQQQRVPLRSPSRRWPTRRAAASCKRLPQPAQGSTVSGAGRQRSRAACSWLRGSAPSATSRRSAAARSAGGRPRRSCAARRACRCGRSRRCPASRSGAAGGPGADLLGHGAHVVGGGDDRRRASARAPA